MARDSERIETLIDLMARVPGLGPRSARRAVLALLRKRGALMAPLADLMGDVARTARDCTICGNIGTADVCSICADAARERTTLCVVETVADLWAIERSAMFKGRYHVLGGTLSALDAVGPDELRIPRLVTRVGEDGVSEVILALNATVDGQMTAHYIAEALAAAVSAGVQLTSLAQGVPIGGELDYLDDGTIGTALRARKAF